MSLVYEIAENMNMGKRVPRFGMCTQVRGDPKSDILILL